MGQLRYFGYVPLPYSKEILERVVTVYYLVYPDGSLLFLEPVSEDFAYHCLLLAIDKDLGLTAVKAPTLVGAVFFVPPFAPFRLPPLSLSALK